jgi:hypothetical protein
LGAPKKPSNAIKSSLQRCRWVPNTVNRGIFLIGNQKRRAIPPSALAAPGSIFIAIHVGKGYYQGHTKSRVGRLCYHYPTHHTARAHRAGFRNRRSACRWGWHGPVSGVRRCCATLLATSCCCDRNFTGSVRGQHRGRGRGRGRSCGRLLGRRGVMGCKGFGPCSRRLVNPLACRSVSFIKSKKNRKRIRYSRVQHFPDDPPHIRHGALPGLRRDLHSQKPPLEAQ